MLISIVVPVYNAEKYLPKCLDSIINQTYKNIEVILVNDGSTDESGNICEVYSKKDTRILNINKINEGVSIARIVGVDKACGEYIMFVDADDYISLNAVESLVENAKKKPSDIVVGQYFEVIDNIQGEAEIRPKIGYYNKNDIEYFLKDDFLINQHTFKEGMMGYLWGKLFRRTLVERTILLGNGLFFAEDKLVLFGSLMNACSMLVIETRIYYYVRRDSSVTKSYNRQIWDNFNTFFTKLTRIDKKSILVNQLKYYKLSVLLYILQKEVINIDNILDSREFLISQKESNVLFRCLEDKFPFLGIKKEIQILLLKNSIIAYLLINKIKHHMT